MEWSSMSLVIISLSQFETAIKRLDPYKKSSTFPFKISWIQLVSKKGDIDFWLNKRLVGSVKIGVLIIYCRMEQVPVMESRSRVTSRTPKRLTLQDKLYLHCQFPRVLRALRTPGTMKEKYFPWVSVDSLNGVEPRRTLSSHFNTPDRGNRCLRAFTR